MTTINTSLVVEPLKPLDTSIWLKSFKSFNLTEKPLKHIKTFKVVKELCALRGYFGAPMRPKNEICFHQIIHISSLEQWSKCISLILV